MIYLDVPFYDVYLVLAQLELVEQPVLAWELAKGDHMFVIPGAHRPETILDSLKADQLELTPEELAKLG